MDKRKLSIIFAIIIVALLPTAVFASVIIDQSYSVSTTTATNPIILTQGPNYKAANDLKFTTLTNGTATTTNTITVGYVDNDTSVELVDVLEIENKSSVKAPTYVDLSVSSTSDITIYYSTSPVSSTTYFPTTTDLGTALSTSATTIHMTTGSALYLSIVVTGSSSITLTMDYSIQ